MGRILSCTSVTAILFGMTTLQASADVTSADVWDALKAQMSVYGNVTASETNSGGSLSVSDIVMATNVEDINTSTALSGSIVFRELGDGTVAIDFPGSMTADMTVMEAGSAPATISVTFAQQGMTILASGDPGAITHDFSAPSMTYSLANFIVEGQPITANFTLDLTDTAGSWLSEGTATRRQKADYTISQIAFKGLFADPTSPDKGAFNGAINDIKVTSDSKVPEGMADLKPEELFTTGFAVDADMSFGMTTYDAQITAEGQATEIKGTIGNGSFGLGMDGERIRYSTQSNSVDISGAVTGLPFPPVDVHFDTSSLDFLMPIGKTDEAQDFTAAIKMKGVTVSDFLWAMIDPGQQLPRDAANVVVDLSGKANWLVNIFDEAAMETTKMPGKLESLALNDLEVTVAGASLTGSGAFTFDNNDLQSFGGMPRPLGAIDLAMSGGITLLDKLTAMNLVPQEQAMGIKMMTGMFTKPGASPDTLTTRIEVDASGAVLANGQRIQ
ncbi:DUF2125 domain-containing protein [uncultured Litoreibacter sp.]|uniref:DUF2125 domain-containing protein n=1 Tax=uncultured Litoreibacter sp. TaxID=1392394 RepID=UPI002611E980|nr:DUF2125 domain-containing protein [uncultured Litoreibacter sp.]